MELILLYWLEIYLAGAMTCFLMINHVWKDAGKYSVGVITITVVLLSSFSWALIVLCFLMMIFSSKKKI